MPVSPDLQTAIDAATVAEASQNQAATAIISYVATVPQQIADAVAAAVAKGATDAQLTEMGDLEDKITSEAAALKAALNTPPPASAKRK